MAATPAKIPVAVVVLTLNEVERIERCLDSARGFAQVIVVDSLSKDGTLDRARELWRGWGEDPAALTLVSRAWPGFTRARNESLQWVREPWTLWLDADEWVSEELRAWCRGLPARPAPDAPPLYQIARQSFFLGTRIRHGGWYPDRKRRLALSSRAVWRSGPHGSDVHEELDIALDGESAIALTAHGDIYHEGFRDEAEQRATNDHYSSLLAQGLAARWKKAGRTRAPSKVYVLVKMGVKFVENYVFKLGFLDGRAGYKIALGSAWSMGRRLEKAGRLLEESKGLP